MRLRWTAAAAADLENINSYLSANHPSYRAATIRRLHAAAVSLTSHPLKGKLGTVQGTRELFLGPLPYVIVYRVKDEFIELLRFYHSAQNRI